MPMTEPERLEYLIKTLEGGNAKAFGIKIGCSESSVSRMRSGKYGIKKKINDILFAYPAVNREWIESGEGYPGDLTIDLVKQHYESKISKTDRIIDNLMKRIDDLEKKLEANQ